MRLNEPQAAFQSKYKSLMLLDYHSIAHALPMVDVGYLRATRKVSPTLEGVLHGYNKHTMLFRRAEESLVLAPHPQPS
jgi:hypothetical protein